MRRRPSNSVEDDEPGPQPSLEYGKAELNGAVKNEQEHGSQARIAQRTLERRTSSKLNSNIPPDPIPETWQRASKSPTDGYNRRPRQAQQSPWAFSVLTFSISFAAILFLATILHSFLHRQHDPKGCQMSYMMPMFAHFSDFDTEHTRFATKYSLYMYREGGIDEDTRVKGIPVIFIPGNAGSYKQVRPIAAEAATYFHNVLRGDEFAIDNGKRPFDFFSIDFNEDITAFHGQTLLDQAEYLNEAVAFILALYHNPGRRQRDSDLPEPKSVMLVGHSMGGIVARTMMTMPNYQEHSVNTIITLSAPHARPPVSFDADMVTTYNRVNDYWRRSYLDNSAGLGPLSDVTLVSVAGGGLDTMIPSEYTSLQSLVPETHGFTVFTSSIPHVWTSMDHLAIMWCDQFRKVLVKSMFDVVDARRRGQTKPRHERIAALRKRLLTGLEPDSTILPGHEDDLTLILDRQAIIAANLDSHVALRNLGGDDQQTAAAHLMPLTTGSRSQIQARLLTNQVLNAGISALLCKTAQSTQHAAQTIDLSISASNVHLRCTNVAGLAIALPASYFLSLNAFDDSPPFTYLDLDTHRLAGMEYFVILKQSSEQHGWSPPGGWAFAEVIPETDSHMTISRGHQQLIFDRLNVKLPVGRALSVDIRIPELHSPLFTYEFTLKQSNSEHRPFMPLVRQHIGEPHESKYFVNTKGGSLNVHGLSPYMPPSLHGSAAEGLSLQIWSDPTSNSTIEISLKIDFLSSAGKIVMRYRTALAVLPLLVVLIVVRKQFKVYDTTGLFISFSSSMDQCIRTSLPFIFIALTFLAISLSKSAQGGWVHGRISAFFGRTETSSIDFYINDLMLGTQDPVLWFLVPLFGIITVGICITANYIVIILMSIVTTTYGTIKSRLRGNAEIGSVITNASECTLTIERHAATSSTMPSQRILTTAVLLLLVTTLVPYQFAYIVLTMVQLATCTRAARNAQVSQTATDYNFYNYTHSLLMLMLWVLPINMPVLIVWIHNLAVHWMTPFSTHHNLLAILPLVLCIESMSTGNMVPRVTGQGRHLTNMLTFGSALYAAVFGFTYAYRLHYLLNILSAWILVVHLANTNTGLLAVLARPVRAVIGMTADVSSEDRSAQERDVKKRP